MTTQFWDARAKNNSAKLWITNKVDVIENNDTESALWSSNTAGLMKNGWFKTEQHRRSQRLPPPPVTLWEVIHAKLAESSNESKPEKLLTEKQKLAKEKREEKKRKRQEEREESVAEKAKEETEKKERAAIRAKAAEDKIRDKRAKIKDAGKLQDYDDKIKAKQEKQARAKAEREIKQEQKAAIQAKVKAAKDGEEGGLVAIKLRVFPTTEQKQILEQWFEATRQCYNRAIEMVRYQGFEVNNSDDRSALRGKIANAENIENDPTMEWMLDVPATFRHDAVTEATKAMKATKQREVNQRMKGGKTSDAVFKFKKKGVGNDGIVVRAKSWNEKCHQFSKIYGRGVLKTEEGKRLPRLLLHDARLIRTRTGRYYLVMLRGRKLNTVNINTHHATIAIDPGERTFMTGYDADGYVHKWETECITSPTNPIFKAQRRMDAIRSRIGTLKAEFEQKDKTVKDPMWRRTRMGKKRRRKIYNLRARQREIMFRLSSKIDDLHRKLCKWLCTNFRVILLPKYSTKRKTQKVGRKIGTSTVRNMLSMRHYQFEQRLQSKAMYYPHCKVIMCDEEYTTKTCGQCGALNDVGSNETFRCAHCDALPADRDGHAARNILLRYMSKQNIDI